MLFFDHAAREFTVPDTLLDLATGSEGQQIVGYYSRSSLEQSQTDVPVVWKRPLGAGVLRTLTQLSYRRCPFCERQGVRLRPYRFRPPAYAEPIQRSGDRASYLWLAFNWANLFPICADCRPDGPSFFPVIGARARPPRRVSLSMLVSPNEAPEEEALLLYPGQIRRAPSTFRARVDGYLVGVGPRATATIAHFSLNRESLVRERSKLAHQAIGYLADPNVFLLFGEPDFRTQPFGGYLYLLYHRIGWAIARALGESPSLGLEVISRTFSRFRALSDYEDRLRAALTEIESEDSDAEGDTAASLTGVASLGDSFPRLTGVQIRNFKSLRNVRMRLRESPLLEVAASAGAAPPEGRGAGTPSLLILGENAAGKSSLLEAIALAAMPLDDLTRLLPPEQGQRVPLNGTHLGGRPGARKREVASVELRFSGGPSRTLSIHPTGSFERADSAPLRQPLVFAYGAGRLYNPREHRTLTGHTDTLFRSEARIPNPELWLAGLAKRDPAALDEVVSALRYIIEIDGEFEGIELGDPREGGQHCVINLKKTRASGSTYQVRQRLDATSSGYRALLALVCDIIRGLLAAERGLERELGWRRSSSDRARAARHLPAIVLVDEIEAHLHPRWKLQIMSGLRKALPNVLFVATSHDPLCLRGMHAGEVAMLNRYTTRGGPFPEAVELVSDFEDFENLTVEQLLTSNLFQLYSTDDRRVDQGFAEVAAILAQRRNGNTLTPKQSAILDRFNDEITSALPFGRTEVTQVVQEAVADYLSMRRTDDNKQRGLARDRAKAAVVQFLRGLPT